MSRIKYPIGIQTFETIRTEGYLYVDKTSYIHELVSTGQYYFLSRPRRFGKSLLISTIEAFFKGKRELFKGLAIDYLEWDWMEYPVIHIDLNGKEYREEIHLEQSLNENLIRYENLLGYTGEGKTADERLRTLIREMHDKSGRNVVVLIDEYDQPILRALDNRALYDNFRSKLQAFYSGLKSMDRYIRFAMLTGITKFSKVSIFSGLNNLRDISLNKTYNSLCGITEKELTDYFSQSISHMADSQGVSTDEIHSLLKHNYDGYHFSADGEDVYNPFSLLNTFADMKISDYWFATATPNYLVRLLERSNFPIPEIDGYKCHESLLTGSDIYLKDPIPILFQSGYLTIKDYDEEFNEYTLGFPNVEVSKGFSNFLMKSYLHGSDNATSFITSFIKDVRSGAVDDFMKGLQAFTAGIPYDHIFYGDKKSISKTIMEVHYKNVMYIVFKLMGFHTHTEWRTSDGRIDMLVETDNYIYIMEFKIDSSPEEALRQINDKDYALPLRSSGKKIFKIGANFSTRTRRLSKWLVEED